VKSLGMDVGIDFHGRVHRPMAKQLAAALEPLHPMFIEEPLLSDHPAELARLALQTSIPIALGERLYTRWDFRPMLESGAVDIIQPDVAHCGGISELKRIAAMAEAYDVALAPHSPLGPIALAACLQIGASCPNHVIQEMSLNIHYNVGGFDLLTYVVNKEVFEVKNKGWVDVPMGPGIGVDIDEDMVRKIASEKPAAWRSVIWRGENGELREW
jgi:galactonate dehydratase